MVSGFLAIRFFNTDRFNQKSFNNAGFIRFTKGIVMIQ